MKRLVMINHLCIWEMNISLFSCVLQVTSSALDPDLGFTIISCFISPNSNTNMPSDYTLIETVCPTDESVRFYPQRGFPGLLTQTDKKSFSFTFNSKFNMSLLFLHCEMSLCSKRSQSNQILPPVCSIIFSKLLSFFCMFNESLLCLIWAILYCLQLSQKHGLMQGLSSIQLLTKMSLHLGFYFHFFLTAYSVQLSCKPFSLLFNSFHLKK